ncbi:ankyrin repeat-containing protein BDA1-like [Syzygium oleosum]|uniref:ankyrin repeat-containing protein BDA1-like n=1 Tax=Syzygium oleosum TaxID=219896 RepID=UPI0011D1D0D6|nr:ankyrin repeat-containing protein BDA1-like [Syzygium oleosum]
MERRLLEAAQKGSIDELNDLIGSNGLINLEEMALKGAGHTPLHVACMARHSDFVRALLKLMPKFVEKVNAGDLSPPHIAAAQGDVEVARELLRAGEHLCFVKGRERRIPLHYAVVNGELHVMELLLSAWPESTKETTARDEIVLHLTVKNNQFDAVIVVKICLEFEPIERNPTQDLLKESPKLIICGRLLWKYRILVWR